MNLFSANDFNQLKNAMQKHEEIVLQRTLGNLEMTAKTLPVTSPWPVDMIVQVKKEQGNVMWIQNFANIEDARRACAR